jgi:hypothetical protein
VQTQEGRTAGQANLLGQLLQGWAGSGVGLWDFRAPNCCQRQGGEGTEQRVLILLRVRSQACYLLLWVTPAPLCPPLPPSFLPLLLLPAEKTGHQQVRSKLPATFNMTCHYIPKAVFTSTMDRRSPSSTKVQLLLLPGQAPLDSLLRTHDFSPLNLNFKPPGGTGV